MNVVRLRAWGPHFLLEVSIKRTEVNEEIRDREVRLIDVDGRQIGIVPIREALEAADEAKLDLVKIAPQARPPVCKIMDYGKYKYEQAKMEKEAKKKQRVIQVKEIRLSVNIDDGDMETKARHAIRFLEAGDRLKVSLRFRGRQLSRKELGLEVVERFGEMIKEYGEVDKRPAIEGRSVVGYYAPIKK
jgi:translation initiation factor IF-3